MTAINKHRKARLRFAPSPTGPLHIGGIRTALYNYLLARQLNGQFILRIEDTDQGRYVQGAEHYIIECLNWLGLIPDEGPGFGGLHTPYRQSERKNIYRQHALQLIENGKAYYAFDSAAELDDLRNSNGGNQKYDASTRGKMRNSINLSANEVKALVDSGIPHVIRLKIESGQTIKVKDAVRGEVEFSSSELDDKVLFKSDGMPTYHLANVVDDHLMEISHVIRGEEWLSSTAHHVLLYRAFGWEETMPQFAHLPLILKPSGNGKLSKRDGAQFGFPVFPINWHAEDGAVYSGFREYGFEPDALLNFLALLGWNPGIERELFDVKEMTALFSLDKIVKSGARFDFEKAKWFNQQYLSKMDKNVVLQKINSLFQTSKLSLSETELDTIYDLYKERVIFLKDYAEQAQLYFTTVLNYDQTFLEKKYKPEFEQALIKVGQIIEDCEITEPEKIELALKEYLQSGDIKAGELFPLLRVVMVGVPTGPDVFKMISFTGKIRMSEKIRSFLDHLKK